MVDVKYSSAILLIFTKVSILSYCYILYTTLNTFMKTIDVVERALTIITNTKTTCQPLIQKHLSMVVFVFFSLIASSPNL
jgi:hypothetical protein